MSERDPLTELDAFLRGDDFAFSPSALACASRYLQSLEAQAESDEDIEDLTVAIAACESIYRHLNRA